MIYKLLNKLFGWDYIQLRYPPNEGVSRVQLDGMNRVWHWQIRVTILANISYDDKVIHIIQRPEDVMWLTCSPDKYFPPSGPKPTNADVLKALKRAHRFINTIPHLHNVDGTVDISEIIESSYKEGSVLLQTIEQLEGTKQ
jgi:hypothetical protein